MKKFNNTKPHIVLDLKDLNDIQLKIVKQVNNQIIEYQQVFNEQPGELLITKLAYNKLVGEDKVKEMMENNTYPEYLLLGNIKIYYI